MADETTTPAVAAVATPAAAPAKPKSIMDIRTPIFFPTVDDAAAYLNRIGQAFTDEAETIPNPDYVPDFNDAPMVLNGLDEGGDFDANVYTADMQVMFHVLTNRGKTSKDAQGNDIKSQKVLRAVIVTPAPLMSAVEADKTGAEWLASIFRTQITKAACDPIRTATDLKAASKDMPLSLTDYVTTDRGTGTMYEAFDALFRPILDLFKTKSAAFMRARLNKSEFKKSLESRAYALDVYQNLEDRGDKPSMFVMALHFAIAEAKKAGLDPQIFQTWLDERDEAEMPDPDTDTDELDDLDSLEGLTLAAPATATDAAPAVTAEVPSEEPAAEPTEENTAPAVTEPTA